MMNWCTTTQMWQQCGTERALGNMTPETVASGSKIKAAWRCGLCGHNRGPCCSQSIPLIWTFRTDPEGGRGTQPAEHGRWATSPQLWSHAVLLDSHQTEAPEGHAYVSDRFLKCKIKAGMLMSCMKHLAAKLSKLHRLHQGDTLGTTMLRQMSGMQGKLTYLCSSQVI